MILHGDFPASLKQQVGRGVAYRILRRFALDERRLVEHQRAEPIVRLFIERFIQLGPLVKAKPVCHHPLAN